MFLDDLEKRLHHVFDTTADSKKKARRSSSRPGATRTASASSVSSEDYAVKMPENNVIDNALKRLSLANLHSPRSSTHSVPQQRASLDCIVESPPLVFYGPKDASSGALFSGQLKLTVRDDTFSVNSFKMRLVVETTMKKPFHAHCHDCSHQSADVKTWNFLQGGASFKKGEHKFPFSFLLPGHLPASTKGSLSKIEYVLRATLKPATGEPITFTQVINIKRAIRPSEVPRNSIRIFPPTNLTANCLLPSVIHPIGEFNLSMRIDGVVNRNADTKIQTNWTLSRMSWRLDETNQVISPACVKHAAKIKGGDAEAKKGLPHKDVRKIGGAELLSGWKSDHSSNDGTIEFEFPFGIRADANPTCDMKAEDGTEITHQLEVEMVMTEEWAHIATPLRVTPTNSGRVLRMHFNVVVTDRGGLGISWDEEQPPLYENVPGSPPRYGSITDAPSIPDYESLDLRVPGSSDSSARQSPAA